MGEGEGEEGKEEKRVWRDREGIRMGRVRWEGYEERKERRDVIKVENVQRGDKERKCKEC